MTRLSCTNCTKPAKLLWVAGAVEWWRCSVPTCGHLFSAWGSIASIRNRRAAFQAIPETAQHSVQLQQTA
jgi:hypothetical protein